MARRPATEPRVSVVVATCNAEKTVLRALESVLNQNIREVQVVVADYGSTDQTLAMAHRLAERDIRIDVVPEVSAHELEARDRGLAAARGAYVCFMDGDCWFGAGSLIAGLETLEAEGCDAAVPRRLFDTFGADNSRDSREEALDRNSGSSPASRSELMLALVDADALDISDGFFFRRSLLADAGLSFAASGGDLAFNIATLALSAHPGYIQNMSFHLPEQFAAQEFAPQMFERSVAEQQLLVSFLEKEASAEDAQMRMVLDRRFYRRVVRCIENVCLAQNTISVNERNARVRDMVNAQGTREAALTLKPVSRELGFMYGAIARRSVTACCWGAWVSNLVHTSQRLNARA